MRPVRRADNLTTFMCLLSWNLGASTSWNPQGLSRPVQGLHDISFLLIYVRGWVDARAIVRPEGLCQLNIPMTPLGNFFNVYNLCTLDPWRWPHGWPKQVGFHSVYKLISIHLCALLIPLLYTRFQFAARVKTILKIVIVRPLSARPHGQPFIYLTATRNLGTSCHICRFVKYF